MPDRYIWFETGVHGIPFLLTVVLAVHLYWRKGIAGRQATNKPEVIAHRIVMAGLSIVAGICAGCFFHFNGHGDDGRLVIVIPFFGLALSLFVLIVAAVFYYLLRFLPTRNEPPRPLNTFTVFIVNGVLFGLFYYVCRIGN